MRLREAEGGGAAWDLVQASGGQPARRESTLALGWPLAAATHMGAERGRAPQRCRGGGGCCKGQA